MEPIYLLLFPLRGDSEGAGAYPSCILERGMAHPWMSHQLVAGPYLSIWWFIILRKRACAVL